MKAGGYGWVPLQVAEKWLVVEYAKACGWGALISQPLEL